MRFDYEISYKMREYFKECGISINIEKLVNNLKIAMGTYRGGCTIFIHINDLIYIPAVSVIDQDYIIKKPFDKYCIDVVKQSNQYKSQYTGPWLRERINGFMNGRLSTAGIRNSLRMTCMLAYANPNKIITASSNDGKDIYNIVYKDGEFICSDLVETHIKNAVDNATILNPETSIKIKDSLNNYIEVFLNTSDGIIGAEMSNINTSIQYVVVRDMYVRHAYRHLGIGGRLLSEIRNRYNDSFIFIDASVLQRVGVSISTKRLKQFILNNNFIDISNVFGRPSNPLYMYNDPSQIALLESVIKI